MASGRFVPPLLALLGLLGGLAGTPRGAAAQFSGGAFVAIGTFDRQQQLEIVTGPGAGRPPQIRVFFGSGALDFEFTAYDPAFLGGARVAACDLDGDAVDEIVTAPGPGLGSLVKVFRVTFNIPSPVATVTEVLSFQAYEPAFQGGVHLACGNVLGASPFRNQLVTGAGEGGPPLVRVWNVDLAAQASTMVIEGMAFEPAFRGGARVAVGDFDLDGRAEIVIARGPGGVAQVLVVRLQSPGGVPTGVTVLANLAASGFPGGLFPAVANVENALTGAISEIVVGPGTGAGSDVLVVGLVGGQSLAAAPLPVFAAGLTGGTAVTAGHLLPGLDAQIVAASGPGTPTRVRVVEGNGAPTATDFPPY
jgi:hypothetical protein